METPIYSIFNEVLGPIMYGPSSSHSAAPCRIGYLCQSLLNTPLERAEIYFDPASSYAATYKYHCSDRGFVAGLLGIGVDQEDNRRAFEIARARGIEITFTIAPQENKHPNYAKLCLHGGGDDVTVGTISTGGGMLELVSLDEFPIDVSGDRWYAFVKNPEGQSRLLIAESFDGTFPELPSGEWTRHCAPILPVPALAAYDMPFRTYKEAVAYAKEHDLTAGELGIVYECARSGKSREQVLAMMREIMDVMHRSVRDSISRPETVLQDIYPLKAGSVSRWNSDLPEALSQIAAISTYAIAVFEHTLTIGKVVAAPTGGSCGVIPAAVVELGIQMGMTEEQIIRGLFAAGIVGIFIAQDATFGCEVAGCQAENGSGSAMAAAGLTEMLGAAAEDAFGAGAIAMQNTLGLVCDPIGCAYVPCVTRNAMAAVNAVSAATLVCSGYKVYIPLDETIQTMMSVGKNMPACHRCTGGGLNLTPSGIRLNEQEQRYRDSL